MTEKQFTAVQTETASLNAQAEECLQRRDYDGARRHLDSSLQRAATKEALRMRGFVAAMDKDQDKALELLDAALEIDEEDAETVCALGDVYAAADQAAQALGYYMLAAQMAPGEAKYKARFLLIAPAVAVNAFNAPLAEIVQACLETPGLGCASVANLWYTLLVTGACDRLFPLKDGARVFDAAAFAALGDFSLFSSPYFRAGLNGKIVVKQTAFEDLLAALRGRLLAALDDPQALPGLDAEKRLQLAADVARYCFSVDYIIDMPDAEKEKVAALRAKIDHADDVAALKEHIAVYATAAPLHALADSGAIAAALGDDPLLAGLITEQIAAMKDLRENAEKVAVLTEIDDAVSLKVREQYEGFPYPVWNELPAHMLFQECFMRDLAQRGGAAALVAGCGTGREAVWLARSLPHASVLAVDLSRASLAYAAAKSAAFGTENVTFAQADILRLGALDKKFDLISCGGVLHHMADPLAGWRVLAGLLKEGGLMRIALYSESARRDIVTAIRVIREKGYPATADGIRRFRRDAKDILPRATLLKLAQFDDYYYMPMCRDLLFHVQEHRFDIPKIAAALDTLGLEFMQMADEKITAAYRAVYPDDPSGSDLGNWDAFERERPYTFAGMYQFWCKKKEG